MTKRDRSRRELISLIEMQKEVEKRQRLIVEAVRKMDMNEVSRLQIGRIRSLAGRTIAVMAVADNDGGKTPGKHNPYEVKPGSLVKRP